MATPVKAMCDRRRVRPVSPRKSSVRKALFGPVDHDEIKKDLDQQMAILKAADRSRWNFDFSGESPLPGRFDWEKVDECSPVGSIPSAYSMSCLTVSGLETAFPIRYTNSRFVKNTTTAGEREAVPARCQRNASTETRTPSKVDMDTQTTDYEKTNEKKTLQAKIPGMYRRPV